MHPSTTGRRRLIVAPALLTAALLTARLLTLTLTACAGGSGTAPTTTPTESGSATSASPTASETAAAAAIALDQDVPGERPVVTQYDGDLRPLSEIHQMVCLPAAAGDEELPTVETGDLSNEQDGLVDLLTAAAQVDGGPELRIEFLSGAGPEVMDSPLYTTPTQMLQAYQPTVQ